VVWGQESVKKWSDLMPKNGTVTNSGKISLQLFMIKILVFTFYIVGHYHDEDEMHRPGDVAFS